MVKVEGFEQRAGDGAYVCIQNMTPSARAAALCAPNASRAERARAIIDAEFAAWQAEVWDGDAAAAFAAGWKARDEHVG